MNLRTVAFSVLLAVAACEHVIAQEPVTPKPPTDYTQVIARLEDAVRYEVEQKDLPAFSIALVDDQRVAWSAGFGFQDAERNVRATDKTVYRVGSVSKLFTDIAVMQLVEKDQLDLDVPVTDYLPEFQPENPHGIPITLRQLMSHQSGLVRESPVGHYFDPTEPSLSDTVESLNSTALVYEPMTRTKYSNAAIAVVGAVLEKQLGSAYSQAIDRSILKPLGMIDSSFELTDQVNQALASARMWTYDGRRFAAPKFSLGTAPAGNMYSNVIDLSKFIRCLFRQGRVDETQILLPATLREMTTPVKDAQGKPQGFGIGFQVSEFEGHTKIGHGGAVYGFSTQLELLTDRRMGVAAVSALDGSNGVVRRICEYSLRLMLAAQDGKPLPTYRTTVPIARQRAREFAGVYRSDENLATVTEIGGELFLHRGTYRYRLRAASDDGTVLTDDVLGFGTPVRLDEGGHLVIGDRTYTRIKNVVPPPPPKRWQGLIGEYGWDHNTLYILEQRGRLYALIEWFYLYPLEEIDENEFAFPDYGLYHGEKLKFVRRDSIATQVVAAEVLFQRRPTAAAGETFKITPLKPIDELRSAALSAEPPQEDRPRDPELVDLTSLDDTIKLDIRYASDNNFMGSVFYQQPRALMQRPAAEALVRVHQSLKPLGFGLLIHDAYRPWHVTKMFWDATPSDLKDFVANPKNGSRHNRGCAVDLTLYHLSTGEPVAMVAGYDEFSSRAFPEYPGGTSRQRWHRSLLRKQMESEGFEVYEFEWWHFDHQDWKEYPIMNVTFEEVAGSR